MKGLLVKPAICDIGMNEIIVNSNRTTKRNNYSHAQSPGSYMLIKEEFKIKKLCSHHELAIEKRLEVN